jgi:hypothetical protein
VYAGDAAGGRYKAVTGFAEADGIPAVPAGDCEGMAERFGPIGEMKRR